MTTVIKLGGRGPQAPLPPVTGRPGRGRLLYEEVIDLVNQIVAARGLEPGDLLPSQAELAELAGVSLITVRRALEELERDGRVRRRQGLGTFLARPKIVADPARPGAFGTALGGTGEPAEVSTQVLGITRGLPSPDAASALGVASGQEVWHVRRLRLIDGKPSIAETAIIPVNLAPDLASEYTGGSLYETLRARYGLDDEYEEQFLDVISPDAEARALLRLLPRALVVRIQGVTRDRTGVAFDCFEHVYSASEFAFAIAGQTERRLHQGRIGRDLALASTTDRSDISEGPSRDRTPPARRRGRAGEPGGSGRPRARGRRDG